MSVYHIRLHKDVHLSMVLQVEAVTQEEAEAKGKRQVQQAQDDPVAFDMHHGDLWFEECATVEIADVVYARESRTHGAS